MRVPRQIDWPPVWLGAFMAIGWGLGEIWSPLGGGLTWTGRFLIAGGVLLAVWAAVEFRRARTTIVPRETPSALVDSGPYRLSRNPIYVADMMILAGWVLTTGQPLGLVLLWPFARVLERRFIRPEEAILDFHIGAPYRAYCARVRRWL